MDSNIAAKIRNSVLLFGLGFIALFVLFTLLFGSFMLNDQVKKVSRELPQIIMRTQVEPFLSQSYGSMRTTVRNLTRDGEENGIAYVGMSDGSGRIHTTGISSHFSDTVKSEIEENYLGDIEDLIIFRENHHTLKDGTEIKEVIVPVRPDQAGQTYGALKIGFIPSVYTDQWKIFRNRIIIITIFLILIFTILVLIYSQKWRALIQNQLSRRETRLQEKYEYKLDEFEAQHSSGPLSTEEFFEIIDFSKKLSTSLDPVDVLHYIVNSARRILNVKSVIIFLRSSENPEILSGQMGLKDGEWMDRDRLKDIEIEIGTGEIGTIAELGQTNILDKPRPGAGVAGALRTEGQTIGVLRASEKQSGSRMGNKEKLKTRLICQLSGDIIAHSFTFRQFKENGPETEAH